MGKRKPLYEKYSGEELKVAEKIQQRRLQMLVHSRLYYKLDQNIVSDSQWAAWGKELEQLQNDYPKIAKGVIYHKEFESWDASTGAFLPLDDKWICEKTAYILSIQKGY